MGVYGRDLGHVADDVADGRRTNSASQRGDGVWAALRSALAKTEDRSPAARSMLSGEYTRMQDTFRNLGIGLVLASLLIYFLMVALFKSYITPLVILAAVPLGCRGRDHSCCT